MNYNYGYQYPYMQQNGAMPDMLGQYKAPYQPQIQQPTMPQQNIPMSQNQPKSDFIFVLSKVEAEAYPVAPNNTVTLWDKNEPIIYIKSADANGMPSMRVLEFAEQMPNTPKMPSNAPKTHECTCGDKFITKDEYRKLESKIERLEGIIDDLKEKPKTTSAKSKKVEVDE